MNIRSILTIFSILLAKISFAQVQYQIVSTPLCWNDSSVVRFNLVTAQGAVVNLGAYNAQGNAVTISGGTLDIGYCDGDTIPGNIPDIIARNGLYMPVDNMDSIVIHLGGDLIEDTYIGNDSLPYRFTIGDTLGDFLTFIRIDKESEGKNIVLLNEVTRQGVPDTVIGSAIIIRDPDPSDSGISGAEIRTRNDDLSKQSSIYLYNKGTETDLRISSESDGTSVIELYGDSIIISAQDELSTIDDTSSFFKITTDSIVIIPFDTFKINTKTVRDGIALENDVLALRQNKNADFVPLTSILPDTAFQNLANTNLSQTTLARTYDLFNAGSLKFQAGEDWNIELGTRFTRKYALLGKDFGLNGYVGFLVDSIPDYNVRLGVFDPNKSENAYAIFNEDGSFSLRTQFEPSPFNDLEGIQDTLRFNGFTHIYAGRFDDDITTTDTATYLLVPQLGTSSGKGRIMKKKLADLSPRLLTVPYPDSMTYKPPFDIFRNNDEVLGYSITPSFNLQTYASIEVDSIVYVDPLSGSDSNDGTSSSPLASVDFAISSTEADRIVLRKGYYYKNKSIDNTIPDRAIEFVGDYSSGTGDSIYLTLDLANEAGVFSPISNYYVATIPEAITAVYDAHNLDSYGDPSPLVAETSIAGVDATPNSWFYDAGNIYIRTFDSRAIDSDIRIVNTVLPNIRLRNNFSYYFKNINFIAGSIQADPADSLGGCRVFIDSCSMLQAPVIANGLDEIFIFNTVARQTTGNDVFNYDDNNGVKPDAIEYNNRAYNTTTDASCTNCQASTIHNGVRIIRINGVYADTRGQNIADVGGVNTEDVGESFNVGCIAKGAIPSSSSGFLFGTGPRVRAWLYNCRSEQSTGRFSIDQALNSIVDTLYFSGDQPVSGTIGILSLNYNNPDSIPVRLLEGVTGLSNDPTLSSFSQTEIPTVYAVRKYADSAGLPASTLGATAYYNGSSWIDNTFLFNNLTNIGIGTTSPADFIHASGSTGNILFRFQSLVSGQEVGFSLVNNSGQFWKIATQNTLRSGSLIFGTSNSIGSDGNCRMIITRSGLVGIGTGTSRDPYTKLEIRQSGLSASTVSDYFTLTNETPSGTAQVGYGSGIVFKQADNAGNTDDVVKLKSVAVDATSASEDVNFVVSTIEGGTLRDRFKVGESDAKYLVSGTEYVMPKTLTASAVLDFPSTAAGTNSELTIALTGAADGDQVLLGYTSGASVSVGTFTAKCVAANTVTVVYSNNDLLNTVDPGSGTFKVSVIK